MKLNDISSMSVRNLWRRKGRTILTILGVIIGSTSIVLMISIGLGQERMLQERLNDFGNIKVINVEGGGGWIDEKMAGSGTPPKLDDEAVSMMKKLEGVTAVMPSVALNLSLKTGRYEGYSNVQGVDLTLLDKFGFEVGEGEMPTADERNTLLVGSAFTEQFYNPKSRTWQPADFDPLSSRFKGYVNGEIDRNGNPKRPNNFFVKGVLKATNESDYMVFMDIEQVFKLMADEQRKNPTEEGRKALREPTYNRVQILCDDIDAVESVNETLKEMNFMAFSPMEYIKFEKQNLQTQKMVLGGIGAVSFLVAAIGIMNTMIMAIYERTREIGVMKVLGAELRSIMFMFLIEIYIKW